MKKQDKIIDKVRKLIAKAESTDSVDEANIFMAKANDLLTKHNLSKSDVEVHSSDIDENFEEFGQIKHEGEWERYLISVLCEFNLCQSIIHYKHENKKRLHHGKFSIIGTYENVVFVHFAYDVCRQVFRREARKTYNELKKVQCELYGEDELTLQRCKILPYRTVYIRAFLKGCCTGLFRKLEQSQKQNEQQQQDIKRSDNSFDSTESNDYEVMVTNHSNAVEKWKQEKYPDLSKARSIKKTKQRDAFEAGHNTGSSIDLNKGVEGSVEREKIA